MRLIDIIYQTVQLMEYVNNRCVFGGVGVTALPLNKIRLACLIERCNTSLRHWHIRIWAITISIRHANFGGTGRDSYGAIIRPMPFLFQAWVVHGRWSSG